MDFVNEIIQGLEVEIGYTIMKLEELNNNMDRLKNIKQNRFLIFIIRKKITDEYFNKRIITNGRYKPHQWEKNNQLKNEINKRLEEYDNEFLIREEDLRDIPQAYYRIN